MIEATELIFFSKKMWYGTKAHGDLNIKNGDHGVKRELGQAEPSTNWHLGMSENGVYTQL